MYILVLLILVLYPINKLNLFNRFFNLYFMQESVTTNESV